MEVHQLRYFVAVADLGSFTRAAEKCLVAQPSLSQQVIKLEKELRQPLFERLGRTVRLTEAGRSLYLQAVPILSAMDDIHERVTEATGPGLGTINVGAIPTVAPYLLPAVLHRFSRRFPSAVVALHENFTELTIKACLEGEIDLGIIASSLEKGFLEEEVLFTEELHLALPRAHPLAKKRRVTLEDVAREPFVLMNEMHCLGEQVIAFCEQGGCLPVVRCRSAQLLTVQELVALGHGISLVPALARYADRGPRCVYRSLAGIRPTRTLRMIWHRSRRHPALVTEFMQALRDEARNRKCPDKTG